MSSSALDNQATYQHIYSGKVRDTYEVAQDVLLMVASDRISAFDVVLPSLVPGKGVVLTQLSRFWFELLAHIVPNHLTSGGTNNQMVGEIKDRSTLVRRADRIPIECVVRGYLAGSGWVEYQQIGSIAGHALPAELRQGDRLPDPIFTPARKNDTGHDENISVAELSEFVGSEVATQLERTSLDLYQQAHAHALARGVIIADTKFEFGWIDGALTLIDEVLTPDSSRFWDAAQWRPGSDQVSFDKQFVRNWLLHSGWNREPPGPELPAEIIDGTRARYFEAFNLLTGESLDTWLAQRRDEVHS